MKDTSAQERKGRLAGLVIAGTAVLWVLVSFVGARMGLSQRVLALFDLVALAGFIFALWMVFQIWRSRQDKQG